MRSLIFGLLMFWTSLVWAQDAWIHVSGRSFHERGNFRGWNPGLGIERSFDQDWTWAAGWYQNSIDRTSSYGLIKRSWRMDHGWQINANIGGVGGYQGYSVAPVLLPEVCWHWLCGFYIPKLGQDNVAAAAFYLRIPL